MFTMTMYPKSGYDNPNDALFPSEANDSIFVPDADPNSTRVVGPQAPTTPQGSRQIGKLGTNYIALFIQNSQQPLILELSQDTMLGRHTPDQTLRPRVDLTPFDAAAKGVSRLHAVIRRTPNGLEIWDLASSNGTKLNDLELEPYLPTVLKSGDHLKLGNLEIEVRFD
jgi:pSer/pThr/pTyr-binding forkhead associated (FHA) protein